MGDSFSDRGPLQAEWPDTDGKVARQPAKPTSALLFLLLAEFKSTSTLIKNEVYKYPNKHVKGCPNYAKVTASFQRKQRSQHGAKQKSTRRAALRHREVLHDCGAIPLNPYTYTPYTLHPKP